MMTECPFISSLCSSKEEWRQLAEARMARICELEADVKKLKNSLDYQHEFLAQRQKIYGKRKEEVEQLKKENGTLRNTNICLAADVRDIKAAQPWAKSHYGKSPKPVVWARKVDRAYRLCLDNGNIIEPVKYKFSSPDGFKRIISAWWSLDVEVRVWEEFDTRPRCEFCGQLLLHEKHKSDCKLAQPEHEWVYGVWPKAKTFDVFKGGTLLGTKHTLEECIPLFIKQGNCLDDGENDKAWVHSDFTTIPTFGVRRLTEREISHGRVAGEYCAFYKGKCIPLSGSGLQLGPEYCIEWVLRNLTPATPAVTLEDLPTA